MAKDSLARKWAAGAKTRSAGRIIRTPIVEFLGDSITAATNATSNRFDAHSHVSWMRALSLGRIKVVPANVLGVSGVGTAALISDQLPLALASDATVSVVHIGTNDLVTLALPVATILTNLDTIIRALNGAGKLVIVVPPLPRSSPSAFSATQKQQCGRIAQWLHEQALINPGLMVVDVTASIIDASTGDAATGMLSDGIHPTTAGAHIIGTALADALNTLMPAPQPSFIRLGDTFNATENPTGNLLTNGLLAGAAGSLQNGATGTPPDSWLGKLSAASTVTAAFSKEAYTGVTNLERAVVTVGGTAGSQQIELRQTFVLPTGLAAGDRVYATCEVEWSGVSNIHACYLAISSNTVIVTGYDLYEGTAYQGFPASGRALLRTPEIVIPSGAPSVACSGYVRPYASGGVALAGTVKFSRFAVRKVV